MNMGERGISDTEILQHKYTVRGSTKTKTKKKSHNLAQYKMLMCNYVFHLCLTNTGRRAYTVTWAMQYINLFMINIGFLILGGSALKVRSYCLNTLIFLVKSTFWVEDSCYKRLQNILKTIQ